MKSKFHSDLTIWRQLEADIDQQSKDIKSKTKIKLDNNDKLLIRVTADIKTLKTETCHTCGQSFHGAKHADTLQIKQDDKKEFTRLKKKYNKEMAKITEVEYDELDDKPETFYEDLEDAYNHRNSVINLSQQLEKKQEEIDPYIEQIASMENEALKEIDYTELNEYGQMRDHQDFLYRLLTNKDSFIRKRIIEQNLAHLNSRLGHYLEEMGLPHQVKFLNDLSVEITELGRDLDFDNLSRGERNRLILSLSWAFRDVWEALYQPINLLFIDELIDSGLDSKGVDAALGVLKKMSRERNKSIWLVSHRDELISRVGSILKVRKENGYTNFAQDE